MDRTNAKRLQIGRAAKVVGASPSSIRDWIKQGLIEKDSKGLIDMEKLKRIAADKKTAMRGKAVTQTRSDQARDARETQLAVTRQERGDILTDDEEDRADLSKKRSMAMYTNEALKALVASEKLVSTQHCIELFARFQKEVMERITGIPNRWSVRLADKGLEQKTAMDFLQFMSDEIINDLATDDLVDKLTDDFKD